MKRKWQNSGRKSVHEKRQPTTKATLCIQVGLSANSEPTEIPESFRQQGKKYTISVTATMSKMQPIKPALKYSRGTCAAAFLFFFISFRNFAQPLLSIINVMSFSVLFVLYSGPNRGLVRLPRGSPCPTDY